MTLLAKIANDPNDSSTRRAGAPLNLCEKIRMGVLKARGCILSAAEECELSDLTDRDRAETAQGNIFQGPRQ
jgi:hypothetical protein